MDHFEYRDGVLHAEGVNLVELADTIATPFYCYSTATLQHHYSVLQNACKQVGLTDTLICDLGASLVMQAKCLGHVSNIEHFATPAILSLQEVASKRAGGHLKPDRPNLPQPLGPVA